MEDGSQGRQVPSLAGRRVVTNGVRPDVRCQELLDLLPDGSLQRFRVQDCFSLRRGTLEESFALHKTGLQRMTPVTPPVAGVVLLYGTFALFCRAAVPVMFMLQRP